MFIRHPSTLMNPDLFQKIKSPPGPWLPGPRTLLQLTGQDRVRFLNGQVTQDLKKLLPGHAVRAAIITAKGRLEADLRISATSETLLLETDWILREPLRARLEKFIIADDVAVEDISSSFSLAHFPSLSSPPSDIPPNALPFSCARFREPGLDLWIPASASLNPQASPLSAWEPLRISRGLPLWGVDIGSDTLPPEAGFESDAISSTKGCYIGQEVISRLRSVGHVNRHLCVVGTENSTPSSSNDCTTQDGSVIGKISSFTSIPDRTGQIALAMIRRDQAKPGNSILAGGIVWTILRHA
jgi:folate-binding protein YgfZ